MNAFLLAAGLGTRLRPLTDTVPKALVPVLSVPMLDRLAAALARGEVTAFALNTHHLPNVVEEHLHASGGTGRFSAHPEIPVRLYHEPELQGTGGGVLNAADFWSDAPLLVWNADILAEVEPAALMAAQAAEPETLATLVTSGRTATSRLVFDADGVLCGIDSPRRYDHRILREPHGALRPRAFHGISVLSPALRRRMERRADRLLGPGGAFDLIDALLEAVADSCVIRAYDAGTTFWGSTGTPKELERLERELGTRQELLKRWTP